MKRVFFIMIPIFLLSCGGCKHKQQQQELHKTGNIKSVGSHPVTLTDSYGKKLDVIGIKINMGTSNNPQIDSFWYVPPNMVVGVDLHFEKTKKVFGPNGNKRPIIFNSCPKCEFHSEFILLPPRNHLKDCKLY